MDRLTPVALCASLVLLICSSGTSQAQSWVPAGSYQQSCTNVRVHGERLIANCRGDGNQYLMTSIGVHACGEADIANINGRLMCKGYTGTYHRRGVPGGSYLQSCANARMNGTVLLANCKNGYGSYVATRLSVQHCSPGVDIANVNGRLRCY